MAANYKLGPLESRFVFTGAQTGRRVEAVSTPAGYMIADEFTDGLMFSHPDHTPAWYWVQFTHALACVTMRANGLVEFPLPLTRETIFDVLNRWEYEVVEEYQPEPDPEGEKAPDPLADAQGGGRETAAGE